MNHTSTMDQQTQAPVWKRKLKEAFSIGIWGALIWSFVGYIGYWLNLSKISPSHISKTFIKSEYLFHWQGILFSLLLLVFFSIIVSLLYVFFFSHIYTPWIGIALGAVIWYGLLGWRKIDMNSFATTLSIFILYGAFVGYSLSIEFSSVEKSKK